ncbi:MAG: hypothetical protein U0232_13935 [Thermomicrobiales bacterium]
MRQLAAQAIDLGGAAKLGKDGAGVLPRAGIGPIAGDALARLWGGRRAGGCRPLAGLGPAIAGVELGVLHDAGDVNDATVRDVGGFDRGDDVGDGARGELGFDVGFQVGAIGEAEGLVA